MRNRRIFRNEPERVAKEEIKQSEIYPALPDWDYSVYSPQAAVVAAIRRGEIPPQRVLEEIRKVDYSGNSEKWGEEYRFPQDKIAGIFMSDRLPDWWKSKKLRVTGRGRAEWAVCASFVPTFFDDEDWKEGLDENGLALLDWVYGCAPLSAEWDWDRVRAGLEEMFCLHPNLAKTTHDMFGNNALHYCYAGYTDWNGSPNAYLPGEWDLGANQLADFLIGYGCDPKEENDFGVAFCDILF